MFHDPLKQLALPRGRSRSASPVQGEWFGEVAKNLAGDGIPDDLVIPVLAPIHATGDSDPASSVVVEARP
jgi:hypothetical protein